MIIINPTQNSPEITTLNEVKQYLEIDLDYTGEDELLNELITSNREVMEKHLNISLVDRVGVIYQSSFDVCRSRLNLPYSPTSVTSINGVLIGASNYVYQSGILSGWFSGDIEIVYNTQAVKSVALKTCLKKMVANDFKYREDYSSEQLYELQEKALDKVEYYSNNLYL